MQLRAALLIAFGPLLTTCLEPVVAANGAAAAAAAAAPAAVTAAAAAGTVAATPLAVAGGAVTAGVDPAAGGTAGGVVTTPAKDLTVVQQAVAKPPPVVKAEAPTVMDKIKSFFDNPKSDRVCIKPPMMPQTFTAKRKFASFLNVIEFSDAKGEVFGFVESWFIDWKNPFGYSGASFYLKAAPKAATKGVWSMDPKKGENGWQAPSPPPSASGESEKKKQDELFKKQQEYDREHGTKSADAGGLDAQAGFLHGIFSDNKNKFVAYITGDQRPGPIGKPFSSRMTIRNCQGAWKIQAFEGAVFGGVDEANSDLAAEYKTVRSVEENAVIVQDLAVPAVELVRIEMKEPCKPFPPFCAQMGLWNWFIHGDEWQGKVTQPGYNNSVGAGLASVQMTDGAATDMRFLALYSAYQFSNTRWSPLMGYVTNIILVVCIALLIRCCFTTAPRPSPKVSAEAREETQKLMTTVEAQDKEMSPPPKQGMFACCSRNGRAVAVK